MKTENQSYSQGGVRPSLTIDALSVRLPAHHAVRNVSLVVRPHSIHCLVGDSGSGKTITSLATVGLLPPGSATTGTVELAGVDGNVLRFDHRRWCTVRGRAIGYVGQNALSCLHPAYTVEFQLIEAIRRHQTLSKAEARTLAVDELAAVDLPNPAGVAASRPAQLSGGMCQRVALALALCNRPAVLIADEPTTALDSETQRHVLALLRSRAERDGLGVLLITHDQSIVRDIADETTALADGVSTPQRQVPPLPTVPRPTVKPSDAVTGRAPVLEVSEITKTYRRSKFGARNSPTLSNVNLSAPKGSTVGLVGRSGSGKTTVARIIAGILAPCSGEVRIAGRPIFGPGAAKRVEKAGLVQYVFQDPFGSLNPRRSVEAQAAESLVATGADPTDARDRARRLLTDVGLTTVQMERRPTGLSGGQCQRVGIARALIAKPHVVVLDEPVSALDWSIRRDILAILVELQEATGATYLLIAHDRPLIAQQCDQTYEMADGTVRQVA